MLNSFIFLVGFYFVYFLLCFQWFAYKAVAKEYFKRRNWPFWVEIFMLVFIPITFPSKQVWEHPNVFFFIGWSIAIWIAVF